VLLLGATAVAGYALLGDDAAEVTANDRPAVAAGTEDDSPTAEPTPTDAPTTTEPPASTAPTTAPASARCWDGSRETRLRDCRPPTGQRGLRWVFPQLDRTTCSGSHRSATRPQIWSCTGYLADGTAIALNYSQWYRVAPGVAHYDRDSYDKETLDNGLVRWWIISRTGDYKAALMYADAPWSVTVYAPTEGARDRGIRAFATMRPRAQLLGPG
jgi:hypothetical protein